MFRKVLFSLLVLALTFVVADTVVRIAAHRGAVQEPEKDLFVQDPEIGAWVHVPNSSAVASWRGTAPHRVSYNAFGFRGPYPKTFEKPAGIIRIVVLGESSTEGGLVEDGKTWPEVLQRELDRALGTGRVEVINMGTSGYSTAVSIRNFKKRGLPLKPDIVLVYHGNNDFFGWLQARFKADLVLEESYVDYENRNASWLERLACKSIILDRLNRHWYARGGERNRTYLRNYWADADKTTLDLAGVESGSVRALQELIEMGKTNGFRVVVGRHATLIKPEINEQELYAMWEILRYRHKGKRLAWSVFVDGLDRLKEAQRRCAEANGAVWLDVEARVPKTLECFIDHVHYSEAGEKFVGSAFAGGIQLRSSRMAR